MLDTILNNFAAQVKEKIAKLTNELKKTYDFQNVEDAVSELVDDVATAILQACLAEV